MADATAAPPSMNAAADDRIPPRRLFTFLIMVFGMFMSILDIQVVSASLQQIQAGLSASSTEVSWVQTSYLIAEVIAIPLSGFLSRSAPVCCLRFPPPASPSRASSAALPRPSSR
jgi:DHA2 family multidrug resistance protein